MRETKFIEQNKEKWSEFEAILKQKLQDPDKLSKLFIEVTDDLSYSRTHYTNRSVRVYLNGLAQQVFYNIYRNKRNTKAKFIEFWTDELPRNIYESRKAFYLSTIIFVVAFIIGVVSSIYDPEFANVILGPEYIKVTLENIENGDPMGIYKDSGEVDMFLGITLNNLRVDILTFVSGLFASIGSIFVMLYNGIMVGTFQYFFIERGLFWESFLTIWMHGSLEIPTIIISGAAGMVFGSGLILPGTYGRLRSFLLSARRGVKLLLGVIPITIAAGFIESFLTRLTDAPPLVRGLFIFLGFSSILFYYVYYPWIKSKQGFRTKEHKDELAATTPIELPLNKIRSVGEIVADTFGTYSLFFGRILLAAVVLAGLYAAYFVLFVYERIDLALDLVGQGGMFTDQIYQLGRVLSMYNLWYNHSLIIPAAIVILSLLTICGYIVSRFSGIEKIDKHVFDNNDVASFIRSKYLSIISFTGILLALLFVPNGANWFILLPVIPFFVVAYVTGIIENIDPLKSITRAWHMVRQNFGDFVLLHFALTLLASMFIWLTSTTLVLFYVQAFEMNLMFDADSYGIFSTAVMSFIITAAIVLIQPLFFVAYSLFFFRAREISEAPGLLAQIESVGTQKRLYGLEQEA